MKAKTTETRDRVNSYNRWHYHNRKKNNPEYKARCHRYYLRTKEKVISRAKARWRRIRFTAEGAWRVLTMGGLRRSGGSINKEWFIAWYNSQPKVCVYCLRAESDIKKQETGFKRRPLEIDRINNEEGYEPWNIALACHRCNLTKSDFFDAEDMKVIGRLVAKKYKQ